MARPPASQQYVSVGVFSSGTYLWVAQQKVETSIQSPPAYTNTAEVKSVPTSLARGGHDLLETEVVITQPFTNLTISAFNLLGYEDTFQLGDPVKLLGGSFCYEETKWELRARQSISRKSLGKIELTYRDLINLDQSLDETKDGNKINIKIPITALSEARPGQYAFTLGVEVGPDTVVSSTQDITITEQVATPSAASGQTSGTVQPLTPRVFPGSSAVFLIDITVPGSLSWELKVTGDIREGSKKKTRKIFGNFEFLGSGIDLFTKTNNFCSTDFCCILQKKISFHIERKIVRS